MSEIYIVGALFVWGILAIYNQCRQERKEREQQKDVLLLYLYLKLKEKEEQEQAFITEFTGIHEKFKRDNVA